MAFQDDVRRMYTDQEGNPKWGCLMITAVGILLAFLALIQEPREPKHNPNGGYMSLDVINQKIDRGEELTPAEKERLNKVLFDKRWDGDN